VQDSERLPSGYTRIGYDADDQTYTFRGPDGRIYESEPGCRYGELWPIGERPQRSDTEVEAHNVLLKRDNREALRMVLPFALLIFVSMMLLFKLVNRGGGDGADHGTQQVIDCAEGSHQIQVHKGDTCWAIGQRYSLDVRDLLELSGNERVDCNSLGVGQAICVPG
jgi:hypothetical protein